MAEEKKKKVVKKTNAKKSNSNTKKKVNAKKAEPKKSVSKKTTTKNKEVKKPEIKKEELKKTITTKVEEVKEKVVAKKEPEKIDYSKIVKNNAGFIVAIVFFVLLAANSLMGHISFYNKTANTQLEYIEKCEGEYLGNHEYDEFCDNVLREGEIEKYDGRFVFLDSVRPCSNYLIFLVPFVLVATMLFDHKTQKLNRDKVCLKDFFKRTYKYTLLFPLFILGLLATSIVYSPNFNTEQILNYDWYFTFIRGESIWFSILNILFYFMVNTYLFSLFVIAISEIIYIKTSKFEFEILSFISIYAILIIFFELVIKRFVAAFNQNAAEYFNLLVYYDINLGYFPMIFRNIVLALVPILIIYFISKQEKLTK